jgi:nucleoside-diphosphate-sugar epimerase
MADNNNQDEPTQASKPTVFITGADSGAGRALVRQLVTRGHRVVGSTHNGSQGAFTIREDGGLPVYPDFEREGEIRSVLLMSRAEIIVHLMAQPLNGLPYSVLNVTPYLSLLRQGTDNLLQAAGNVGIRRVIFPSFTSIYGDADGETVDETASTSRANLLFQALAAAEAAVQDGTIPGYVLRAGFTYGANSAATRQLADTLRAGNGIPSGTGLAGWVHEDDLMRAILLLIDRPFADEPLEEIYNIVDDTPATPTQFAEKFAEALGAMPLFSRGGGFAAMLRRPDPVQKDLLHNSAAPSNEKARQQLGWTPEYSDQRAGIEQLLLRWRADAANAADSTDKQALAVTTDS